jgi:hypothetical protein
LSSATACSHNSITHIKYGIQNYVFEEVGREEGTTQKVKKDRGPRKKKAIFGDLSLYYINRER